MLNVSCLENHMDQQQWLDLDAFNDYEYLTSDASSHPLHPQISMLVLTARAQAAKKNQCEHRCNVDIGGAGGHCSSPVMKPSEVKYS